MNCSRVTSPKKEFLLASHAIRKLILDLEKKENRESHTWLISRDGSQHFLNFVLTRLEAERSHSDLQKTVTVSKFQKLFLNLPSVLSLPFSPYFLDRRHWKLPRFPSSFRRPSRHSWLRRFSASCFCSFSVRRKCLSKVIKEKGRGRSSFSKMWCDWIWPRGTPFSR